jgi:hypothetical protein
MRITIVNEIMRLTNFAIIASFVEKFDSGPCPMAADFSTGVLWFILDSIVNYFFCKTIFYVKDISHYNLYELIITVTP